MPILVSVIGYLIFPFLMEKSILGNTVDFANCEITRRDPQTGERVSTSETVEIIPIDYDVKLIEAETIEGGIFGMGFLHAKERLWQMHFFRLLSNGRLSELLGPLGLSIDKHMRTMGVVRAVNAFIDNISDDERESLELYSKGVNKVVENLKVYPAEFYVFWTDFEPWQPRDSVAIFYFFTYILSGDSWNGMLRERLLEIYDRSLVERIMPNRQENYFGHPLSTTISDDELARINMLLTEEEAE